MGARRNRGASACALKALAVHLRRTAPWRAPPPRAPPSRGAGFHWPVDGRHTRHIVLRADALRQQPISDLPRKHGRILALVVGYRVHDGRRGHFWLRPAYNTGLEAARLVVPAKQTSAECISTVFFFWRFEFKINKPTTAQWCRSETEKNGLEDLFSSVLSKFKKYHPSGNRKFNFLGIFLILKLHILLGKILLISLKQSFTPNTVADMA